MLFYLIFFLFFFIFFVSFLFFSLHIILLCSIFFFLHFFFVLQIRHNVTSIVSKRDHRCAFVSNKRWSMGARERQLLKWAIAKKRPREDTPQYVNIVACIHCFDNCLMFFCCFPSSSFSCKFLLLCNGARWFHSELFVTKEKKRKKKPRIVWFFAIRQKERASENAKKKNISREQHTHTLVPIRSGVNLATVCTLLQLKLSF